MRTPGSYGALTALLALLALFAARLPPQVALADGNPLLIVAGLGYPEADISLASLKTAFRGERTLAGGKAIIPINHPVGAPTRQEFDRLVLGLAPDQVGRFWIDRRIRDEGLPPKSVPTAELAVRVVAALPMAITYARRALLHPKLKVLRVDGKAWSEPGYALGHRAQD